MRSPSGRWRYSFDDAGELSARRADSRVALPVDPGGDVVWLAIAR